MRLAQSGADQYAMAEIIGLGQSEMNGVVSHAKPFGKTESIGRLAPPVCMIV
jgi:hypothetical protein